MQRLSRNGSPVFNPESNGYGVRTRNTLALDLANPSEKRTRISSLSDLALQELGLPPSTRPGETEKVSLQTPTPTQFLFPKHVTEEQAAYAHGFERALEEIYKEKGPPVVAAAKGTTDDQRGTDSCEDTDRHIAESSTVKTVPITNMLNSTMGQFSHGVSQVRVPFINQQVRGNFVSSSSSDFNLQPQTVIASGAGPMRVQVPLGTSSSQSFVNDVKVSHLGSTLHNVQSQVPFHSSQSLASHDFDRVNQVKMTSGQAPPVNWHSVSLPNAPSCAKVLSNATVASVISSIHSNLPSSLSQHGRNYPTQSHIGTNLPVYASAVDSVLPVHSQSGVILPAFSQATPIPPAHSDSRMNPLKSKIRYDGYDTQGSFHPQLCTPSHPNTGISQMANIGMSMTQPFSGTASPAPLPWTTVKCEPTPIGAVNMDEQERLKLERKRAKNRVAAQRCQMRKLERIARLEDKAEKLRDQNLKLLQTVEALRGHITQLKKQITAHASKGCRLMLPDLSTNVSPFSAHCNAT